MPGHTGAPLGVCQGALKVERRKPLFFFALLFFALIPSPAGGGGGPVPPLAPSDRHNSLLVLSALLCARSRPMMLALGPEGARDLAREICPRFGVPPPAADHGVRGRARAPATEGRRLVARTVVSCALLSSPVPPARRRLVVSQRPRAVAAPRGPPVSEPLSAAGPKQEAAGCAARASERRPSALGGGGDDACPDARPCRRPAAAAAAAVKTTTTTRALVTGRRGRLHVPRTGWPVAGGPTSAPTAATLSPVRARPAGWPLSSRGSMLDAAAAMVDDAAAARAADPDTLRGRLRARGLSPPAAVSRPLPVCSRRRRRCSQCARETTGWLGRGNAGRAGSVRRRRRRHHGAAGQLPAREEREGDGRKQTNKQKKKTGDRPWTPCSLARWLARSPRPCPAAGFARCPPARELLLPSAGPSAAPPRPRAGPPARPCARRAHPAAALLCCAPPSAARRPLECAKRAPSVRLGPYHVERTPSRPIWEVKQRRARLVLAWVTGWEYRVPKPRLLPLLLPATCEFQSGLFFPSSFFALSGSGRTAGDSCRLDGPRRATQHRPAR